MSNAPVYKGMGQPVLSQSTGWLRRMNNLLGQGGAPVYEGTGQPVPEATRLLASAPPVYQQAPAMQPAECSRDEEVTVPDATKVLRAAIVCSSDCDPFVNGPIAIIVPRQD
jgi:hypothetical protein